MLLLVIGLGIALRWALGPAAADELESIHPDLVAMRTVAIPVSSFLGEISGFPSLDPSNVEAVVRRNLRHGGDRQFRVVPRLSGPHPPF